MKRWDDLTESQREYVVRGEIDRLLSAITEGAIRFNDKLNGNNLQTQIDAAGQKASKMKTPWFAHEYIIESTYTRENGSEGNVRDFLADIARATAMDAYYLERHEVAIPLPRDKGEKNVQRR